MSDCVCGRPEGTNDDCERCQLLKINADLLAACKAVVELSFENDAAYLKAWKLCWAAIAKAESEGER